MFEFLAEHRISLKIKSWGVTLKLSNLENIEKTVLEVRNVSFSHQISSKSNKQIKFSKLKKTK